MLFFAGIPLPPSPLPVPLDLPPDPEPSEVKAPETIELQVEVELEEPLQISGEMDQNKMAEQLVSTVKGMVGKYYFYFYFMCSFNNATQC